MGEHANLSDDELVVLLNGDDESAFMEIYRRYKAPLAINLIRILKSPDLAEEVLQDLFLMLWEKRREIDPTKSVGGYLYRAALNRAKNIFRRLAYDSRLRADVLKNLMNTDERTVDAWIEAKETKTLVHNLMALLPPQQRTVYTLCKLEGMSYREVSTQLNISETTVNSHIRNANRFLRQEMRKRNGRNFTFYPGLLLFLFY